MANLPLNSARLVVDPPVRPTVPFCRTHNSEHSFAPTAQITNSHPFIFSFYRSPTCVSACCKTARPHVRGGAGSRLLLPLTCTATSQLLSASAGPHVSSLAARQSGPFFSSRSAKRSHSLLMYPGRGIMECPEHGSQKNTQQCAFSCLHSGTLCASVCLVC